MHQGDASLKLPHLSLVVRRRGPEATGLVPSLGTPPPNKAPCGKSHDVS